MIFFVVFYLFFLSLKSDLLPAIRYVIAVLPFFCILSGVVVYYFLKKNRWVGYGILLLLILTNIFYVFPFDLLK
ncbi:hypothetical protein HQ529_00105 [Candidatus Woesearchaeota archaeon]|nr:hypothetical protein [Candidatus Woesearchaeota archaeon]